MWIPRRLLRSRELRPQIHGGIEQLPGREALLTGPLSGGCGLYGQHSKTWRTFVWQVSAGDLIFKMYQRFKIFLRVWFLRFEFSSPSKALRACITMLCILNSKNRWSTSLPPLYPYDVNCFSLNHFSTPPGNHWWCLSLSWLTPAHSRTCWCTDIYGRMTKASLTSAPWKFLKKSWRTLQEFFKKCWRMLQEVFNNFLVLGKFWGREIDTYPWPLDPWPLWCSDFYDFFMVHNFFSNRRKAPFSAACKEERKLSPHCSVPQIAWRVRESKEPCTAFLKYTFLPGLSNTRTWVEITMVKREKTIP